MHYSQQTSSIRLESDEDSGLLRVNGTGFVTRDLLQAGLADYLTAADPGHAGGHNGVMVDVRNVAGYGSGCAFVAVNALDEARRRGIERVALISTSTVLRTATSVLSRRAGLSVRVFTHPESATSWLAGHGPNP